VKAHLARLGKQTLVYGLSAAMLPAVAIITLPVFAREFAPAEFGALEIATVGMAALLVLADLGMASASQRSYYDYSEEQLAERRAVLATAALICLTTATALAVLLIGFRQPLADWLFDGRSYASLLVLVALCLPLAILATFCREVMRLRFQPWHYTTSAASAALLSGALGVGLVLGTDVGVDGVLIGVLAGHAVAVVYGLAVIGRYIGRRLSRVELGIMLRFGLPIVPAAAALWGLSFLDRLMLGRLADLDEVGQFAVGGRFAFVLTLAVTAFGLAYGPFALSLYSEDREAEKQVRARVLTYLVIALTSLSVLLALFAREVTTVIAPDYEEAYRVVGVLCIGVTIFGLSSIAMAGISFARRTTYFAVYSVTALVVNVALNFALIPPLGGVGAALATATAYAVLTTLYYRKAQQLYKTPYEPRKVLAVLMLGAAVAPLGFLPLGIEYVGIKAAALVAFALALLATGVIDRVDIAEIRNLLRRRTGPEATPTASGV
jgi:O-antigen/teichoic acid export membrane protein